MMTKTMFTFNIILFIPLIILNFFGHGIGGCIDFVKLMKKEYVELYRKPKGEEL